MSEISSLTMSNFYPQYYLNLYPDVKNAFGNDFNQVINHYKTYGVNEGRKPNPFFFPKHYVMIYPDLQAVYHENYKGLLDHWLGCGIPEGRCGSPEFDVGFYLNHYPDLISAFGAGNYAAAFQHWLDYGYVEGRQTSVDSPPVDLTLFAQPIHGFIRQDFDSFLGFAKTVRPAKVLKVVKEAAEYAIVLKDLWIDVFEPVAEYVGKKIKECTDKNAKDQHEKDKAEGEQVERENWRHGPF